MITPFLTYPHFNIYLRVCQVLISLFNLKNDIIRIEIEPKRRKDMDLLKKLPETEYEFSIEVEGNTTKLKYSGNFKGVIPTNKIQSAIKRKEAALNSGLESDVSKKLLGLLYDPILDLHYKIAYLSNVIVDSPSFFSESSCGEKLIGDLNVLDVIYNEVIKRENDWYEKIWPSEKKGKNVKTK
jgi:hypothetical protein